ncbi:MAG: GNAT family N-acetyltransferase [Caldilineaceae bacterium]|nr:GNAT family N-acetyltransferase [Caldilineaceae bacterium]
MIAIRPFEMNDEDYRLAVDIGNAVWPDYPEIVEEWKESDAKRSRAEKWGRYFAELEGKTIGYAYYAQSIWVNHPGKLSVGVLVLSEFRNRGAGTALWQHLCREVEQFDPLRLRTSTREDYEDGVRFALKQGFTEKMRDWESRLETAGLDPSEWKRYTRRMAEQGIQIKSVVELESDPARDRKLYELEWSIVKDVPSSETPAKVSFEEFQKVWDRSNHVPDAWFVALDNGEYVGSTDVWLSKAEPHLLYVGLTGVVRSHRGRGIATALKLRSVEFAREQGFKEIRTWNETNNKVILDINDRMGFVRQPAHIDFVKQMREERPEDAHLTIEEKTGGGAAHSGVAAT